MSVYESMRTIAEGKLACECGESPTWEQFLYVSSPEFTVAACKHCGRGYTYNPDQGAWVLKNGPAPEKE